MQFCYGHCCTVPFGQRQMFWSAMVSLFGHGRPNRHGRSTLKTKAALVALAVPLQLRFIKTYIQQNSGECKQKK
jgi:hypothetical protein